MTKKLIEECGELEDTLERSRVVRRICLARIPIKCEGKIIDELEDIGFIEIVDKKNIKVNKKKFEKYTSYF